MTEPGHPNASPGEVRSEIDHAAVTGDVVQARDVSGGVHFHAAGGQAHDPQRTPRQLPADVRLFVNRRTELRRLTRLRAGNARSTAAESSPMSAAAVVVITGSAGVGKTALALRWAHSIRAQFPDGELFANLRGFDDGPLSRPERCWTGSCGTLALTLGGYPMTSTGGRRCSVHVSPTDGCSWCSTTWPTSGRYAR